MRTSMRDDRMLRVHRTRAPKLDGYAARLALSVRRLRSGRVVVTTHRTLSIRLYKNLDIQGAGHEAQQ